MGSLGRLRHICKTIKECSTQSADSHASTLFMNYANVTDLKNLPLPNVSYYSPLKKQNVEAKKIGFETPNNISKKYETVIVSVPKTREEALGQIAIAYEATKLGGLIILEPIKFQIKDSIFGGSIFKFSSNGRGGLNTTDFNQSFSNGAYYSLQSTYKRFGDFESPNYILSNTGSEEIDFSLRLGLNKIDIGFEKEYSNDYHAIMLSLIHI